jgi:hypothetical protein
MRRFRGVIITLGLILTLETAAWADGFKMDRVTIGTRWVEDEDQQNWVYFNSNAKYDWMRMNLQGKLYIPQLSENWIDYSRDGMDDLYSGLRANFRFPEFSRGLDANLGYKWNDDYRVYLYGVGYNWSLMPRLSMGFHYDGAARSELSGTHKTDSVIDPVTMNPVDVYPGKMQRDQEEFSLKYSPDSWAYALSLKRVDYQYPNAELTDNLSYIWDHKLDWQATSKLNVGLRYVTSDTEYYNNSLWEDGNSDRITLDGTLKWDQYWTWYGAYTRWDYSSYNNKEANANSWNVKAKYDYNGLWWVMGKLYVGDYYYNPKYTAAYEDPDDLDADYYSRTQQVIAVEYERKLTKFNYNLEVFIKNFDYDDDTNNGRYDSGSDAGIIGTITWDWLDWHWSFRAAPNGDLSTRKGNYELKATYKF